MLEKCGEQVNVTIGFNVDNAIFIMGFIILASQSVSAVFFCKILCAKPEKHDIHIYLQEGYQSIDMSIRGQISISVISVVWICSTKLKTHGCVIITVAVDALVLNHQWPLLLTWFNFNPSMDKYYTQYIKCGMKLLIHS